jgi:hypothetical protein
VLAAAFVPQAPLLVPVLTGGPDAEAGRVRAACAAAVADVLGERPDAVACVATGEVTRRHPPGARGTLAGYGVAWPDGVAAVTLPPALEIGRWLLDGAGWRGPVELVEVDPDAATQECLAFGAQLAADLPDRAAWLVLGDGSACRSERAPGYLDPTAEAFDAATASALRRGDAAALAAIDAGMAQRLLVSGRAAWQVLAGAASEQEWRRSAVAYDAAPFGVGYLVATWR